MSTVQTDFGPYGGRYVPETLVPALDELVTAWGDAKADPVYWAELDELGRTFAGRPTPLTPAARFAPGVDLWLKREDLLPAPSPGLGRDLQAVIGREARAQILEAAGRLPDTVVACVGGGSNAIGMFSGFLADEGVRIVGVEAAGAASLGTGRAGGLPGAPSPGPAHADGQAAGAPP